MLLSRWEKWYVLPAFREAGNRHSSTRHCNLSWVSTSTDRSKIRWNTTASKGLTTLTKWWKRISRPSDAHPARTLPPIPACFSDIRNVFVTLARSQNTGLQNRDASFQHCRWSLRAMQWKRIQNDEMNFLPTVHVNCESCNGKRYKKETLEVRFKGKINCRCCSIWQSIRPWNSSKINLPFCTRSKHCKQ